jgi:hypothetical protein
LKKDPKNITTSLHSTWVCRQFETVMLNGSENSSGRKQEPRRLSSEAALDF